MLVLRRHRVLSVLLFVLTLFGTAIAYSRQLSTYQTTSSVVFIPSQAFAKDTGGGNPYLAFTTSVNQMGDVIRYQVTGGEEQSALADAGYTSSYTIADATDTAAPILLVTVTGHNETNVENTLSGVDAALTSRLAVLQSGMKASEKAEDKVLTYSAEPTRLSGGKVRTAVVFLVIGVLLSLGILLVLDTVQTDRRRKNRGRYEDDQREGGTKTEAIHSPERTQRAAHDSRKGTEVDPRLQPQAGFHGQQHPSGPNWDQRTGGVR